MSGKASEVGMRQTHSDSNAPRSNTHTKTQSTEQWSPWLPADLLLPGPGGGRRVLQSRAPIPGKQRPSLKEGAETVRRNVLASKNLPAVFHILLFSDKEEWLCVQRTGNAAPVPVTHTDTTSLWSCCLYLTPSCLCLRFLPKRFTCPEDSFPKSHYVKILWARFLKIKLPPWAPKSFWLGAGERVCFKVANKIKQFKPVMRNNQTFSAISHRDQSTTSS